MDVQAVLHRGLNLTMSTIGVFSLLLAIICTRRQPSPVPLANTLSVAFCLCVANTFVAFAGCVVISMTGSALSAR